THLEEVVASIMTAKSFMNLKLVGLMCIPAKTNAPETSFAKMKHFFDTGDFSLHAELTLAGRALGRSADESCGLHCGR
ncbi:YggS family pyridoxal phosphate-dependent enzyme, partial [Francisella tularensis subsp. holarctica]|nr:YggS family pyridoxal phosphate-dependent enzyme [Francisella tularensis subsp. holarctica]